MEDDDIRQRLHATYASDELDPAVARRLLTPDTTPTHRRRFATSLVAVVAAVVVAIPVSVGLLFRAGVLGGPATSSSTPTVLDLHMFTDSSGWAWAGGNQILHTDSGVQHWTIVPPPIGSDVIDEVQWVNAQDARILTTTPNSVNEMERPYALTGWLTDDGGTTWVRGEPLTVDLETGQAPEGSSFGSGGTDFPFVDPLHGWFFDTQDATIGGPILILRTVDGGLHWSVIDQTPSKGTAPPGALPVACTKYGMSFLNATTGWVAGSCGTNGPFFDVTHDGGVTWTPQPFPCGAECVVEAPQFTSPVDGELLAGVSSRDLYVTTDGGKNWTHRNGEVPAAFPYFIDATHGVAMGATGNFNGIGVLWTTSDGGGSWAQVPGGAIHGNGPAEISWLDFITPHTGWAVSLNETMGGGLLTGGQTPFPTPPPALWQTTDGGVTWTVVAPTFSHS
jgi:photosystem II stability/assembly factor-like uncharacterized protein